MLAAMMAAALQNVHKALNIRVDIDVGIFHRVANAGLGGEMNDFREAVLSEQRLRRRAIGQIELLETELRIAFEQFEARLFQLGVVVMVDAVDAEDVAPLGEKLPHDMKADEASGSGDQNHFTLHRLVPV